MAAWTDLFEWEGGAHFEKVWQSNDNLCTVSVLGAAKTQAMPDGRIFVRFREYSEDYDHEKDQPPILRVKLIYKWEEPPTPTRDELDGANRLSVDDKWPYR